LIAQHVKATPSKCVFAVGTRSVSPFVLFLLAIVHKRSIKKIVQTFFTAFEDGMVALIRGVFHYGNFSIVVLLQRQISLN
jgi:hypothetical protein